MSDCPDREMSNAGAAWDHKRAMLVSEPRRRKVDNSVERLPWIVGASDPAEGKLVTGQALIVYGGQTADSCTRRGRAWNVVAVAERRSRAARRGERARRPPRQGVRHSGTFIYRN